MKNSTKRLLINLAVTLAVIALAIGLGILAGQLILDNVI